MLSAVKSGRNWNKIIIMQSLVICNFKKDMIKKNVKRWIYINC